MVICYTLIRKRIHSELLLLRKQCLRPRLMCYNFIRECNSLVGIRNKRKVEWGREGGKCNWRMAVKSNWSVDLGEMLLKRIYIIAGQSSDVLKGELLVGSCFPLVKESFQRVLIPLHSLNVHMQTLFHGVSYPASAGKLQDRMSEVCMKWGAIGTHWVKLVEIYTELAATIWAELEQEVRGHRER